MRQAQDVLAYARHQAEELEKDMTWHPNDHGGYGGYWQAPEKSMASKIAARAVAALEFLRQYAGEDSFWTQRAIATYQSKGDNQSAESGARAVGDLLRAWADQVDAGVVEIAGSRAWAEVGIVSTDVMSQVRRLLEDRGAHPAAAIVLCGAALEIALRAVVQARNLTLPERPSLNILTGLLRKAGLITVQDVKDLEQCAGLRNSAAHGDFDSLSNERAGLMEQQTNILLRRIADLYG
ncbi:hypothetical protein [Frankia sp. CiP3]|uniref:hypothetical protein n=1 Tax=Frankia sp. CiP3 TaxID=2880971 RepID=UPI001EF6CD4A|nr:hypothetical protein [Frankia sp. CiP3]